ncbi:MAG: metallophosphoesterase, partial [Desulfovibrionaceae bacterium]|nr:metallophosphoesterase [Desulfovibrionaceae bacterium]
CITVSQSFNIQRHFFGSLAGPDIPFWLLVLLIWSFCALAMIFLGSAVWDLLSLILHGIARLFVKKPAADETAAPRSESKKGKEGTAGTPASPGRRFFLAATAASGMRLLVPAGAAASAVGVHAAVTLPRLQEWEVFLPALPRGLDGLRVVHMADLHVGPLWDRERALGILSMVEKADADLVCLTGDLADGQPEWRCADNTPRVEIARLFSGLKSRLGTYACTGNHEYFSNYAAWMDVWTGCGMRFLHNECVPLQGRDGSVLLLGGLNDPSGGLRRAGEDPFAEAPVSGPDTFRLLMDHRPSAAAGNARRGAQLQLSGHTHGGQCPGLDIVVARANNGYVRGWYNVRGMGLYVTTGASQWSGFAMRLGVPCEVAVLTLRSAPGQSLHTRLAG